MHRVDDDLLQISMRVVGIHLGKLCECLHADMRAGETVVAKVTHPPRRAVLDMATSSTETVTGERPLVAAAEDQFEKPRELSSPSALGFGRVMIPTRSNADCLTHIMTKTRRKRTMSYCAASRP